MKNYFITTPLYYVNAKPHIGHAYTNVLCDTFARYLRLRNGKEHVFFLTGTDEHGTKIQKAATAQNKTPRVYVDETVELFKHLWTPQLLDITFDRFIRTTDEDHKRIVQKILRDLEAKGDIYKESYKGWYSVQDESFYTETQLREGLPEEIQNTLQEIEEENYFFRMSKYQDKLIQYVEAHPDWIQPEMRRNEVLGFLKNQILEDLCITRPRKRLEWGIDYPGSADHVVYVWFDALINYISAIGYGEDDAKFKKWWPGAVHVLGKDILRQHAVFWPIMLMAIGVEMPEKILAHGWWR
ncbi:MAG TPA: class I tRNA ligase family protein, partial [Candidatus Omnitrophota bacterium]|nr:class I tRNA ligase family protein [Candidatus Omnitrophota bacterium]